MEKKGKRGVEGGEKEQDESKAERRRSRRARRVGRPHRTVALYGRVAKDMATVAQVQGHSQLLKQSS